MSRLYCEYGKHFIILFYNLKKSNLHHSNRFKWHDRQNRKIFTHTRLYLCHTLEQTSYSLSRCSFYNVKNVISKQDKRKRLTSYCSLLVTVCRIFTICFVNKLKIICILQTSECMFLQGMKKKQQRFLLLVSSRSWVTMYTTSRVSAASLFDLSHRISHLPVFWTTQLLHLRPVLLTQCRKG